MTKTGERLRLYECPCCGHYHLTNQVGLCVGTVKTQEGGALERHLLVCLSYLSGDGITMGHDASRRCG